MGSPRELYAGIDVSVTRGYAETAEGQVHYRRAGDGHDGPPVVLLHQNTSSSDLFVEALEALADRYHAVAPDTPGAGRSYVPEAVPGMDYYARVLIEALEDLGVDRFHACGHHTGASVAVEMATRYPDRVETVTASGPPYLTDGEREAYRREYDDGTAAPPPREDGEHLRYHWTEHATVGGTDDLQLRQRQVVDALLGREGLDQAYGVVWDQDFPALFGALSVPRMVMGAPDDALWDGFVRARESHPDVRAVELAGGNYGPLLDAGTFADALDSFLRDHGY